MGKRNETITSREAARIIGYGVRTVADFCKKGVFDCIKSGTGRTARWLIDRTSFEQAIDEGKIPSRRRPIKVNGRYRCPDCGQAFQDFHALGGHRSHTDQGGCSGKPKKSIEDKDEHINRYATCPYCDVPIIFGTLKGHLEQDHHLGSQKEETPPTNGSTAKLMKIAYRASMLSTFVGKVPLAAVEELITEVETRVNGILKEV